MSQPLPTQVPIGASSRFHRKITSIEFRTDRVGQNNSLVQELVAGLRLSKITAQILVARGVASPEEAKAFLFPTLRDHIPNPEEIKNIVPAAERILAAVQAGEKITIYSDFDVDGLTSASQLWLYLSSLGARVHHYVPNRFSEGYGVSQAAVEKIAKDGTRLLITVDCGISNINEFKVAKRLGLSSIIVDHHLPGPSLPPADVVVDPAQDGCPFQAYRLAAAGLVWMLLIVLKRKLDEFSIPQDKALQPKDLLDLAAVGTICDMVPLTGVNRVLAYRGIEALRQSKRLGIVALKEVANLPMTNRFGSGHVSFGIGPRINAAGRLGDAGSVFSLLTTSDSTQASKLAKQIDRLNDERRTIEEGVRESCIRTLVNDANLMAEPAIALFGENYHLGVIGIAAQRLVEEFYKPSAVMAPGTAQYRGETIPVIKGSVRSVRGFHVAEALQALGDVLIQHGGHAEAGGFSLKVENLAAFQAGFIDLARRTLVPELLTPRLEVDANITLGEIDFQLVTELLNLAPFGVANPAPIFVSQGVTVESVSLLQDQHLRVAVSDPTASRAGIAWRMKGHPLLRKNAKVNIAYQLELNTYKGVSSVQLQLKEIWE